MPETRLCSRRCASHAHTSWPSARRTTGSLQRRAQANALLTKTCGSCVHFLGRVNGVRIEPSEDVRRKQTLPVRAMCPLCQFAEVADDCQIAPALPHTWRGWYEHIEASNSLARLPNGHRIASGVARLARKNQSEQPHSTTAIAIAWPQIWQG